MTTKTIDKFEMMDDQALASIEGGFFPVWPGDYGYDPRFPGRLVLKDGAFERIVIA